MPTPMFPLGSVLLPGMPLPLRLFEPRYLQMLQVVLERPEQDFGVVLIERGHEVGGGDARFDVGTLASVRQVEVDDQVAGLIAVGTGRFRVDRWLPDDPFPQAEVTVLPDLVWADGDLALLEETDAVVRSVLARAAEFVQPRWSPDAELDDDPALRCWQLCGIALLGPLDQVDLLRCESVADLLHLLGERTRQMLEFVQISGG